MRSGNSTWICHPWELDYCPSYGEGRKSKPLTRLAGAAAHRRDISSRFQQVASSSCSCSCRMLSQGRGYLVGPPDSAPPNSSHPSQGPHCICMGLQQWGHHWGYSDKSDPFPYSGLWVQSWWLRSQLGNYFVKCPWSNTFWKADAAFGCTLLSVTTTPPAAWEMLPLVIHPGAPLGWLQPWSPLRRSGNSRLSSSPTELCMRGATETCQGTRPALGWGGWCVPFSSPGL